MIKQFVSLDQLAIELQDKINGADDENLAKYGLDKIFPGTVFKFKTHSESGVYEPFERIENTVYRYINGGIALVNSASEGINEYTYNAVIQLRAEFLVPLIGPEEKNNELLNALRLLLMNELKYSTAIEEDVYSPERSSVVYTHITDYAISTTGIRDQREVIGDSVSLTIDISHTYVALGVSSSAIIAKVKNPLTNEWEIVGYSKLGIARKSTVDTNVYSDGTTSVPNAKSTAANTVLTVSMDLLTRVRTLDYYVSRFTYDGICEPIRLSITRPNPERYIGNLEASLTKETEYDMIFDTSGINAEIEKISSTSVTLIEAKTF